MLERFGADFKKFECVGMLKLIYSSLYDNYLLLSQYDKIQSLDAIYNEQYENAKPRSRKMDVLHVVNSLHLGKLYRMLLTFYLHLKYKIFNYRIQ